MWSEFPLFPEQASTVAERVDALYYFLVAVSAGFTLLIAGALLYFAVKYRRRAEDERPGPVPTSIALEIVWMVVPLGLAMIMFVWGAKVYVTLASPPRDALEVYAIGKQWMWKFQHLDGQREINELHVPVGLPIKLTLTSQDVIHSFFVPAFRVKTDVLPGRYTTVWFEATKPGSYHLFCAEYCGTQHSGMIGQVVVMELAQYQSWLSGGGEELAGAGQAPSAPAMGSLAAEGQKLFQKLGCDACHRLDAQGTCPMLAGLYSRPVRLQSGETIVVDDSYVRESILNPAAKVVAGFQPLMPAYQGRVSEEELVQLIAFIKSLREQPAPGAPRGTPAGTQPRPSQR